jgi:hypothetical protein
VRRRAAIAIALAGALALGGCGYRDDNPNAAREVAQAFFDAERAHEADAVCRVLGPALSAAAAAQANGECPEFVTRSFKSSEPALRAGRVTGDKDARVRVFADGHPGQYVGVVRYASVWRIEEAPVLTAP